MFEERANEAMDKRSENDIALTDDDITDLVQKAIQSRNDARVDNQLPHEAQIVAYILQAATDQDTTHLIRMNTNLSKVDEAELGPFADLIKELSTKPSMQMPLHDALLLIQRKSADYSYGGKIKRKKSVYWNIAKSIHSGIVKNCIKKCGSARDNNTILSIVANANGSSRNGVTLEALNDLYETNLQLFHSILTESCKGELGIKTGFTHGTNACSLLDSKKSALFHFVRHFLNLRDAVNLVKMMIINDPVINTDDPVLKKRIKLELCHPGERHKYEITRKRACKLSSKRTLCDQTEAISEKHKQKKVTPTTHAVTTETVVMTPQRKPSSLAVLGPKPNKTITMLRGPRDSFGIARDLLAQTPDDATRVDEEYNNQFLLDGPNIALIAESLREILQRVIATSTWKQYALLRIMHIIDTKYKKMDYDQFENWFDETADPIRFTINLVYKIPRHASLPLVWLEPTKVDGEDAIKAIAEFNSKMCKFVQEVKYLKNFYSFDEKGDIMYSKYVGIKSEAVSSFLKHHGLDYIFLDNFLCAQHIHHNMVKCNITSLIDAKNEDLEKLANVMGGIPSCSSADITLLSCLAPSGKGQAMAANPPLATAAH